MSALNKRAKRISALLRTEWRSSPLRNYKLTKNGQSVGGRVPSTMKAALRLAAERLSKEEDQRVSMIEVLRRLMAAGGLR